MNSKIEQLKEYARIIKDTPYALRTYLQTYDNTQKKYVPMDLFQDQIQLIEDYENYNENITRKYRQAGVTTVTAAWLSKKLQLAKPENPERVLLIANKRDTAVEMANKIRNFLDQWPSWINVGFSPDKNSESRFKLNNGCEVKAVATSPDALRGYTPTILVFDEAAYIEAGEDFWSASMASLSTGGKIILISCVTKDTYVFTKNGLEQVSDFIDENKTIGDGYIVDDYEILGKDKVRKSNLMLNNGKQKTLKIHTVNSILEGTETHKVWGFSNELNKYDWYKLSELKINDYINVNFGMNMWGNQDEINFEYDPSNKEHNIFNPGNKITKELSYFLGLFIAEGSTYKKLDENGKHIGSSITITCGDDISEYIKSIGLTFSSHDNLHYTIGSKSFYSFLEYIGFDLNLKANQKIIPKRLLKMSKENIKFLIRGIYDGDGYVDKIRGRVGIGLSSAELINQLRMLLINFGILTDFNIMNTKPTKKVKVFSVNYRIVSDSINSKIFFDEIGFNFERKSKYYFLHENKDINYNNPKDIIPNGSKLIKEILVKNNLKRKNLDKKFKKIYDDNLRKKNISRKTFKDFIDYFILNNYVVNDIDKIYFENSKWVSIKKIEENENETYDFSLYNDDSDFWCHSIIYNGILGHQTPNGYDPIYYGVYDQAIRKINDFHITDLRWFKDPRYTKDLRWVKCTDIVHYMLNRELYNDDEIVLYDYDIEKYVEYIEDGYKPFSSWFESMSKKFKYDKRKIAQELECLSKNTIITVKDKQTGEIKKMKIGELYNELK